MPRSAPLRLLALLLAFAPGCTADTVSSDEVTSGPGDDSASESVDETADETEAKNSGDLPCDGCAGDPCDENGDCVDGFLCVRANDEFAWCTNCNSLGNACDWTCTEDVQCGVGGVCHTYRCWHECSSGDDCPDNYECLDSGDAMFCAPIGLPELDDECVNSAAGWCESFLEGDGTCVFVGELPNPEASWCSKPCEADSDCTDVWPLGCCSDPSVFSNGEQYCMRSDYAAACDPPPPPGCGPECDYCFEGNCDESWNGDGACDCGCQFEDIDC